MDNNNSSRDFWFLIGYVALIYVTLPTAPYVFSIPTLLFGQRQIEIFINILVISISFCLFLKYYRSVKRHRMWSYLGFAAVVFMYAVILHLTPIAAEKFHLIEYGFLSLLALRLTSQAPDRLTRYLYVMAIVVEVGCCDELIQRLIPNRFCEVKDMILNIISGILGLILLRISGYEDAICLRPRRD